MGEADTFLKHWHAKWQHEDFTWRGLAYNKRLFGWVVVDELLREAESGRIYGQPLPEVAMPVSGREASLQDYWRADPATGRLRSDAEMQRELHVVEGQPTYHLSHLPLFYSDGTPTGKADWPDDALDAIVGPRLVASSETLWSRHADNDKYVGRHARLQGGIWLRAPTHPQGKGIPLSVNLSKSMFARYCDFAGARFAGFNRMGEVFFAADVHCAGTAFIGPVWLTSVLFGGRARFDEATFDDYVEFNAARFHSGARFTTTTFGGEARFEETVFGGEAWFEGTTFKTNSRFDRATFSGAARFEGAGFGGTARFDGVTFRDQARFDSTLFSATARFDKAKFFGEMNFTSAIFEKLASFESIAWPSIATHWHAAFDQALFRGTSVLTGAGFSNFAAFDGATLERGIQFDESDERAAKARFLLERRAAIAAASRDGAEFRAQSTKPPEQSIKAHVKAQREARLRELERGCRVLKLAFERAADKTREQLLYRFELQARRAQIKLAPGEALFSDLYALSADYGASMVRPFVALAVVVTLFAAAYLALGCGIGVTRDVDYLSSAAQAFEFSLTNTFRPFSALSAEDIREESLGGRLLTYDALTALGTRVLSILQALLSIVLAFLFALAVRRRFQIG